jgi:hypothetical protein
MNSVEDILGAFYMDYRTFKKRSVEHAGTAVVQWNPSHRRNIEGEKDVDVRSGVRNFPVTRHIAATLRARRM